MTEETPDEPSLVAFFLVIGWALGGIFGAFGMSTLGPEQQILVSPLVFEWLIIFGTIIEVTDPTAGIDEVEQRSGETNARYTLRVWLSLHVLLLKALFIGIARTPDAARRAVAWLRDTPEGKNR